MCRIEEPPECESVDAECIEQPMFLDDAGGPASGMRRYLAI
jgi:hypothetical protein